MNTLPSSRLERRERSILLKQFWLFAGLAFAIIIIFVFLIIPLVITLMNRLRGTGTDFQVADTLPPQQPQLAAPPAAVNASPLQLRGFTEPGSEVFLLVDGKQKGTQKATDTGEFRFSVPLSEGEQIIVTYAKDAANNTSQESKKYLVTLDTEIPDDLELELSEETQQVVGKDKQRFLIAGRTEPKAKVYLNNRLLLPDKEGAFSTLLYLQPGENVLDFRVVDQGGNEFQAQRKINFTP